MTGNLTRQHSGHGMV